MAKRMLGTAGWLLAHFVATVLLLEVLVRGVFHFRNVFDDFALELPVLTQLVITVSNWACAYWWLIVPAGAVDAGVLFGLRCLPAAARWLSTVWAAIVLLAVILLLGAAFLAVSLPFSELQRPLMQPPGP